MDRGEQTLIVEQILFPTETFLNTNVTNISVRPSENLSSPVSASLAATRFLVQTIITPIVVCVGLLGNVLNILVLMQPAMRTSTNIYLLTLAIADSVYLLFTFALSFVGCERRGLGYAAYAFNPYGRTISDIAGNIAVWIIVIFTMERYVAVCHPLYGKVWCTVTRAKLFSVTAALLCLVNTVPEFFELEVIVTQEGPRCQYTPFSSSPSYELGYTWWYVTIFTFIPFTFLVVFNSFLIHTLVTSARRRQSMLSHGSRLPVGCSSTWHTPAARDVSSQWPPPTAVSSNTDTRGTGCWLSQHTCIFWCPQNQSHTAVENSYVHGRYKHGSSTHRNFKIKQPSLKVRLDDRNEKNEQAQKVVGSTSTFESVPSNTLNSARQENRCESEDWKKSCYLENFGRNGKSRPNGRQSERDRMALESGSMKEDQDGDGPLALKAGSSLTSTASNNPLKGSPAHSDACSSPSFSPRHRLSPSCSSQEQYKVTLMLTVIVVFFILCQLPWTILYLYRASLSAHNLSAAGSEALKIAGNVVNLLVQVNASGNFYLYSFFSKRFRRTLTKLCLFRKRRDSQYLVRV